MDEPLHSTWALWYHSVTDNTWTQSSYKELYSVSTLYELYALHEVLQRHHLQNGMFFLMRDDIFPTWEDPDNREGCCVSFKVKSDILQEQWTLMVNRVVGETLLTSQETRVLNGVSIAPKKEFNIIKLWFRDNHSEFPEWLREHEPCFTKDKCLLKKHELSS
jgi:hypothetical protein